MGTVGHVLRFKYGKWGILSGVMIMSKRQSLGVILLPGPEVLVVGQAADLLEVLDDGELGPHLHLRGQDLLDEVLGLVEVLAEAVQLGVLEEALEAVDGDARLPEVLHLLHLLLAQLVDHRPIPQELGGFSVQVLAEVLGLEAVPLLDLRPLEEGARLDHDLLFFLWISWLAAVLILLRREHGRDFDLGGGRVMVVVVVHADVQQSGPCLDVLPFAVLSREIFFNEQVQLCVGNAELGVVALKTSQPVLARRMPTSVEIVGKIIVHEARIVHKILQIQAIHCSRQQIIYSSHPQPPADPHEFCYNRSDWSRRSGRKIHWMKIRRRRRVAGGGEVGFGERFDLIYIFITDEGNEKEREQSEGLQVHQPQQQALGRHGKRDQGRLLVLRLDQFGLHHSPEPEEHPGQLRLHQDERQGDRGRDHQRAPGQGVLLPQRSGRSHHQEVVLRQGAGGGGAGHVRTLRPQGEGTGWHQRDQGSVQPVPGHQYQRQRHPRVHLGSRPRQGRLPQPAGVLRKVRISMIFTPQLYHTCTHYTHLHPLHSSAHPLLPTKESDWKRFVYFEMHKLIIIAVMQLKRGQSSISKSNSLLLTVERKIKYLERVGEQQSDRVRELLRERAHSPSQNNQQQQHNFLEQMYSNQRQFNPKTARKRYLDQDYVNRVSQPQSPLRSMQYVYDFSENMPLIFPIDEIKANKQLDQQMQYLKSEEYRKYLSSILQAKSKQERVAIIKENRNHNVYLGKETYTERNMHPQGSNEKDKVQKMQFKYKCTKYQYLNGIQESDEEHKAAFVEATQRKKALEHAKTVVVSQDREEKMSLIVISPKKPANESHRSKENSKMIAKDMQSAQVKRISNETYLRQMQFCKRNSHKRVEKAHRRKKEQEKYQYGFKIVEQNKQNQQDRQKDLSDISNTSVESIPNRVYNISFKINKPNKGPPSYDKIIKKEANLLLKRDYPSKTCLNHQKSIKTVCTQSQQKMFLADKFALTPLQTSQTRSVTIRSENEYFKDNSKASRKISLISKSKLKK